mgnify:FL=1
MVVQKGGIFVQFAVPDTSGRVQEAAQDTQGRRGRGGSITLTSLRPTVLRHCVSAIYAYLLAMDFSKLPLAAYARGRSASNAADAMVAILPCCFLHK